MFVIKFFVKSFKIPSLLKNLDEKMWKYIIYAIILILISNFPASFEVVKEGGSRLDFIVEDFNQTTPTNWNLPDEFVIKGGKLVTNGDTTEYVNVFNDITYIINKQEVVKDTNDHKNHILLYEKNIVYIDKDGNVLEGYDYKGFSMDSFSFKSLKLASGEDLTNQFNLFSESIEKSFKDDIVLFTLIRNNVIQIVINIIYAILLAALVMLFKFGYAEFLTFGQSVRFVILSLTIPALLTFVIGLLSVAFAPVIFQLASGLMVMLVVMIFGKKTFV